MTITNDYQTLLTLSKIFDGDFEPKKSFYEFLTQQQPQGIVHYALATFMGDGATWDEYKLNLLKSTPSTLHFECEVLDHGEFDLVYFEMPVEYLTDAKNWEKSTIALMKADREEIESILPVIFGECITPLFNSMSVKRYYLDDDFLVRHNLNAERFLEVSFGKKSKSVNALNDKHKFFLNKSSARIACYDRERKILHYGPYIVDFHENLIVEDDEKNILGFAL